MYECRKWGMESGDREESMMTPRLFSQVTNEEDSKAGEGTGCDN